MAKKNKKIKRTLGRQPKKQQAPGPAGASSRQGILQQAWALHQAGRLAQAETLYRQILLAEPDHPEALQYSGMLAQQTGKGEIAVELMRRALACRPDYVEAYYNLGLVFLMQGKAAEAAATYRQALSLKPNYVEAHNNLGNALQAQGKPAEAIASYRRALALKPDYVEAHYNLGKALQTQGDPAEAIASYRRALALRPDYAEALYNLGILLQALGKSAEAAAAFRRVLDLKPTFVEAHNNLGLVLQTQDKPQEAIASYRRALTLKPDFAEAHSNLGNALQALGRLDEAAACFRRALALKPDYAEAHNNLGIVLNEQGRLDEAIASYGRALALKPDYAEAHYNLGFLFSQFGRIEEAIACFRKAISLKSDYVTAYRGLSTIVKFTEVDDVIQAMENLYKTEGGISHADRINLGFVLGKVFEDIKDYDKSFDYIVEANLLKRGSYEYTTQQDHDLFERIKQTFTPDFFSSHHGYGKRDATPIFILGMPRSGTTLAEQILASHPLVFGAGELKVLINLSDTLCLEGTTGHFPECLSDLGMDAFERIGADYIKKIREYSADAEHITDKMPHNFLRVGLINTILPNAKVIHCVRDPMDTCFSIFKNDFTETHGYAYDMEELGRYYLLYRDLMAHWEKVLPGFMYTLRYEKMVDDQYNQTKNLLDFCGLPWDESCLTFHKAARKVNTASLAQVRQPVYKDSVELWKRYEKRLEPLRKTLIGNGT